LSPAIKELRLNQYIAHCGIASRREADQLIKNGEVSVNGEVVTTLGTKVVPGEDIIKWKGHPVVPQDHIYILLNKPKNTITTADDPEGRKTVLDIIEGASRGMRVYPVGRLDRNTTGLLLLTNDGDMAEKLMHPSYNVRKLYHARLDREITEEDLTLLRKGIELEDGMAKADKVSIVEGADANEIGIEIHSGKNRIVRRMFEALGYEVKYLDRVAFASLTKKDLPRGRWRYLTEKEVNFLKMI
jgi:23S rRNA pseudouridine2605 synthase